MLYEALSEVVILRLDLFAKFDPCCAFLGDCDSVTFVLVGSRLVGLRSSPATERSCVVEGLKWDLSDADIAGACAVRRYFPNRTLIPQCVSYSKYNPVLHSLGHMSCACVGIVIRNKRILVRRTVATRRWSSASSARQHEGYTRNNKARDRVAKMHLLIRAAPAVEQQ